MQVKLIAVDMDGTFLNDHKKYNKKRFMALYEEMKRRGIRFVVASGNQYYQLASFFPEIEEDIGFVAENGGYIVEKGGCIFHGEFTGEDIRKIIEKLEQDKEDIEYVMCGVESAYIKESATPGFVEHMRCYYRKLALVQDLFAVRDIIFKFSAYVPLAKVDYYMADFKKAMSGSVHPVGSGNGFIDFIIPGLHKAHGVQMLQKRWGLRQEEIAAFGDSGNDIEMIAYAQYGFAMANAEAAVMQAAGYRTGSNNEEGVLDGIQALLDGTYERYRI